MDEAHGGHPQSGAGPIPWPCATAELAGQRFKIYKTAVGTATDKTPGTLLSAGKKGIEVACGDGQSLWITELQAEGGKRMSCGGLSAGPSHECLIGVNAMPYYGYLWRLRRFFSE
ncbi:MAG: hypothetical protein ACLSHO_02910 [Dysosmobacter sp.]